MTSALIDSDTGQAQDVLLALVEQSQDCVKILDLAGNLQFMNGFGRQAMGIADFDSVKGREWALLWPEDARDRVRKAVAGAAGGLSARFEEPCPGAGDTLIWWDVNLSPVTAADGERTHIVATSRDITQQVEERASGRLLLEAAENDARHSLAIAREMRHRFKNQLAVIGAVTKLLARHTEDAAQLADKIGYKLSALSRAQDLLTENREKPMTADAAVRKVLEASGAGESVEVGSIPKARVADEAIQTLALVLGELQTNSLKYGALANGDESGSITLTGKKSDSHVILRWHEDTGAPVVPPERMGAGFKLLERLGSTADSRANVSWHASGPTVEFAIRTAAPL